MSDVAVRPARPEDLDALMRLEEEAFETDRLDRRAMRHAVRSETIVSLVAESGGRLAGYALVQVRRGSPTGWLSSVAVTREAAGSGVGRVLLAACEAETKRLGRAALRLEVRADNARAIALYERAGYERRGAIEDYYEDGATALRFGKAV